jgi:formylglycine-generating enzyme required for sulfatase activity
MPSVQYTAYSISGQVTDGNGKGVSGVSVFAKLESTMVYLPLIVRQSISGSSVSNLETNSSNNASSTYYAITDENGYFTIAPLPAGSYTIRAEKNSIEFTPSSQTFTLPGADSQDFQVKILPPTISPNTEVISSDTNQHLASVSQNGSEFSFSQTPELQSLAVGDIMVSGITTAAPNGYLRKVTAITNQDGNVVVSTEPAVLEEAIQDGTAYISESLSPAQVAQTKALPGVTMMTPESDLQRTFLFNVDDVVLYDKDNNLSTTGDQIRANGSIELAMGFEFYVNIQGHELRNMTFASNNTLTNEIKIFSELDLGSIDKEVVLDSLTFDPFDVQIGLVPVVVVPCLEIVVGVDGSVKVGISASVKRESSLRVGVEYVNPAGWRPIRELTLFQPSYEPPSLALSASIKGYYGVRFNLYLYGLAGPFVKVTPFLELEITPLDEPKWSLFTGIDVPAGFKASEPVKDVFKAFGLELEDYEVVVISKKEVVTHAPTTNHAPDLPSSPRPVNDASMAGARVMLSWICGDLENDEVKYDVFFEAGDSSPDVLVTENQIAMNFDPGILASNTTYYWQINATDEHGWSTAGPVWSFTTGDRNFATGEMILIPAGSFQMGCDPAHNGGGLCLSNALPLHAIYINAYRIDKYEVTNAQYAQCVAAGGCAEHPDDYIQTPFIRYYINPAYANYPVVNVAWLDAANYCAWAGKRLPTEAEWEKAARGESDTRAYPWGDQVPDCTLANSSVTGTSKYHCVNAPNAVGSYPAGASSFGVMDMAGNVWEWVNDWYDSSYYKTSPASNPTGPTSGEHYKVTRGGGWFSYLESALRVADRLGILLTESDNDLGFRCASPLP